MASCAETEAVIIITGVARGAAYAAATALSELIEPAANAVSIFEDGRHFRIDAYYANSAQADAALGLLDGIEPAAAAAARVEPLVQQNWVALSQAALPPVYAGRFTVCGSHDLNRVPAGPNTLVVEAGEAFGTAHHATTYGCLLALDRLTRRGSYQSILDLGTGSGVLALALARALPRSRITASDIDRRSIEVACDNAQRNGLSRLNGGPKFVVADGLGDMAVRAAAPFDLIVANILARPLITMAPDIVHALAQLSTLVLSGILVPQAREVCARFSSLGLQLVRHDRHNGWSTLTLTRRAMRARQKLPRFNVYETGSD